MAATGRVIRAEGLGVEHSAAVHEVEVSYDHVLVPLDNSALAAHALPTAHALAERFGADVHTISVARDDDEADRMREQATIALGGVDAGDRVEVVVGGEPVDGIERRYRDLGSAVVCMSTHGRGRAVGALVGSVARSLLQQSRDPIVAVGPFAERPPEFVSRQAPEPLPVPLSVRRLVACVDGSKPSEAVLPVATAWAGALDMSLTILTVADPAFPPLDPDDVWKRRYGPEGNADGYMEDLVARWEHDARDIEGKVVYDPVSPTSGVKAYLDRHAAGLLAVTTHAHRGWRRLFGAGAAGIVRASEAPTLVVPQSG